MVRRGSAETAMDALRRFQQIVEKCLDMVVIFDAQCRAQYVNPAFTAITGYTSREAGGKRFDVLGDIPADVEADIRRAVQTGGSWHGEWQTRRKDGESYWVSSTVTPLTDARGTVTHLVATSQDITERKRIEGALEQSEEHFRSLIEDGSDIIMILSNDGLIRYVSPSVTRIVGYEPGDVVGTRGFDLVHPDDLPLVIESFQRTVVGPNRDIAIEFRARGKDGSWRILESMSRPLGDGSGISVNCRDVTEHHRLRQELERREAYFRSLVEGAADVIAVVGLDGSITYVTPSITRVAGWLPDEVLGAKMFDFVHPDDRPLLVERFRQAIAGTKQEPSTEYRSLARDGSWKTVQSTGRLLPDGSGYVIHSRDITARVQAEEAVRASEEKFRALAEATPAAMMIVQDGRTVYANPASEAVLGYAHNELLAINHLDTVHPDFRDQVRGYALARQRGERAPSRYEAKIITKSGKARWVMSSATAIQYQGRPAALGIAFDITERKLAEEALSVSEEKFRTLAEMTPAAIFMIEGDRLIYVNAAAEAITGYSRDELITMDPWAVLHQDFRERSRARARARERGELLASRYELKIVRKDGEERWIDFSAGVTDLGGRLLVVGSVLDITERKLAEDALRQSEMRFRTLAEMTPASIFIVDEDQIIYANPGSESVTGYTREELTSMSLLEIAHPDFQPEMEERALIRERGEPVPNAEVKIIRKEGGERWVDSRTAMIEFDGRQVALGTAFDITDRKLAVEALKSSEEKFRTVAETAPVGIFMYSDNRFLYVNAMAEEITGYSREELSAVDPWTLLDAQFYAIAREREAARRSGEFDLSRYELKIVRKDGEERWLDCSFAWADIEGRRVVMGSAEDVTERKVAEEALRESEERFRQFAENIDDVVWIADAGKQRIIYVNPAYEAVWGHSPERLFENMGSFLDAVHPEDKDIGQRMLERQVQDRYAPETYRIIRPDGSIRWLRNRAFSINDSSGAVVRIGGIVEDVTEQKLAEEALRRSEERYRTLYQDNPAMYFTVDQYGSVLSVNQFGAEQLGYSAAELTGRQVTDVVHPADRRTFQLHLRRCLRSPEHVASWEFRKVRKNGAIMWVREIARAVRGDDAWPQVLMVCEDITELRVAEEALQRAREELESKVEREIAEGKNPYGITFREMTILHMVVTGNSDKAIATVLGISRRTVNKHVQRILRRMGVSSRTEAGVRAVRDGLVT